MSKRLVTNFPDAPDIESSTWDYKRRFDGATGEWMLQQQATATQTALEKAFPEPRNLRILDVGGGHGQNISLMNQLEHQLTIAGSSQSCTEVISEDIARGKVEFTVSPLLELPFEDDSFDVVICYRVLSHMDSWGSLITELTRVTRHLVLVDYPVSRSVNNFGELFFTLKKRVEGNTRPYNCFSCAEITSAFSTKGFDLTYQHKQFFLPMALHRIMHTLTFSRIVESIFRTVGLTKLFGSPSISGFQPRNRQ